MVTLSEKQKKKSRIFKVSVLRGNSITWLDTYVLAPINYHKIILYRTLRNTTTQITSRLDS